MSNDEAVAVLRKAASKLGPIRLVIAKHKWLKSLDSFSKPDGSNSALNDLKDEPVRPIDPIAWIEHTKNENLAEVDVNNIQLTTKMDMLSIARAMSAPDSGLEIKDRTWLKITFPNSFLGIFHSNFLDNLKLILYFQKITRFRCC